MAPQHMRRLLICVVLASSAPSSAPVIDIRCRADGALLGAGEEAMAATVPCAWHHAEISHAKVEPHCPAARLMESISNGSLNKSDVELVVLAGDDDLTWTEPFSRVRTVYQQGQSAHDYDCIDVVRLRSTGHEAHDILTHIVSHWDSLAERTAFIQGGAPSCGCFARKGLGIGGHLLANVSAADYLAHPLEHATKAGGGAQLFMPLTMRIDANLTAYSLRSGFVQPADAREAVTTGPYAHLGVTPRPVRQAPPVSASTAEPDTATGVDRWLPWEHIDFHADPTASMDAASDSAEENKSGAARNEPRRPRDSAAFSRFFQHVVGRAPPPVLLYAHGAHFAATRQARALLPACRLPVYRLPASRPLDCSRARIARRSERAPLPYPASRGSLTLATVPRVRHAIARPRGWASRAVHSVRADM